MISPTSFHKGHVAENQNIQAKKLKACKRNQKACESRKYKKQNLRKNISDNVSRVG